MTIPRILVVDDEAEIRHGMKTLLEVMGCRVATAGDSESAFAAASIEKPDIALVDYRLPDGDNGLLTIQRLRQLYPLLPAIIISGDIAPDRLLQVENAGIEMLHKPVFVEPLKNAISSACAL